jgi:hypothetical protein
MILSRVKTPKGLFGLRKYFIFSFPDYFVTSFLVFEVFYGNRWKYKTEWKQSSSFVIENENKKWNKKICANWTSPKLLVWWGIFLMLNWIKCFQRSIIFSPNLVGNGAQNHSLGIFPWIPSQNTFDVLTISLTMTDIYWFSRLLFPILVNLHSFWFKFYD